MRGHAHSARRLSATSGGAHPSRGWWVLGPASSGLAGGGEDAPHRACCVQRPSEPDKGRAVDDRLHDLVRADAHVERDPDVILELRLRPAQGGQGGDRDQLPLAVAEPGARVHVAIAELDHVASQIGRDVPQPFDHAFPLLTGQFLQTPPPAFVPIITHHHPFLSGAGPTIAAVIDGEEAMDPMQEAEELLEMEEADAWFEYLEATRNMTSSHKRY